MTKCWAQGYRGSRCSFGYPACPNLADQRVLLDLLRAEEIGVALTEEDQLDPEQSTSAIVVHHPASEILFGVTGSLSGSAQDEIHVDIVIRKKRSGRFRCVLSRPP